MSGAPDASQTTVLLRRYEVRPDAWDEFLRLWQGMRQLREAYGFTVLFGFADKERNEFVWAVRYEGDYEALAKRYYAAPEREPWREIGKHIVRTTVTTVDPIYFPEAL